MATAQSGASPSVHAGDWIGDKISRQIMRLFSAVLFLWLLLADSRVVNAFNELGHSVIAKVAYEKLTPKQRAAIHDVLKKHPHYEEYLTAAKPAGVSDEEWSFIRASTWSDWVRSNHRAKFHKSEWHYINFPYRMGQKTESLPDPLPQPENIIERLPPAIAMVKQNGQENELGLLEILTADERRAVALTWIFHLIGDAHQPLHMVAMINDPNWSAASHGDQGGNGLAIVIEGTKPMRLHAYWDGVLGDDRSYRNMTAVKNALADGPPLSKSELTTLAKQTDFEAWALEGYRLAAQYCYLQGNLTLSPWLMSYDQGADAAADVPRISEADQQNAKKIYRQRLVLAGERLAGQLRGIFP